MQTFKLVKVIHPTKGVMLIREEDYDPTKYKLASQVDESKVDAEKPAGEVAQPKVDAAVKPPDAIVNFPTPPAIDTPPPAVKSETKQNVMPFQRPRPRNFRK